MGYRIVSDLALDPLPGTASGRTCLSVRQRRCEFPPLGEKIREVLGGPTNPYIGIYEGPKGIQYLVGDLFRFSIDTSGTYVEYWYREGTNIADVRQFVLGPILAIALQMRGQVQLHASAIKADCGAVAFSAPGGIGKSTLAASFNRAGHPILTDDVLGLELSESGVKAFPGVPRLKLWDDTLREFGLESEMHVPTLSWLEKRQMAFASIGSPGVRYAPRLKALYLLAPHTDPARPINFEKLEPSSATMALLASMYDGRDAARRSSTTCSCSGLQPHIGRPNPPSFLLPLLPDTS
jgi:hypothetical protein